MPSVQQSKSIHCLAPIRVHFNSDEVAVGLRVLLFDLFARRLMRSGHDGMRGPGPNLNCELVALVLKLVVPVAESVRSPIVTASFAPSRGH